MIPLPELLQIFIVVDVIFVVGIVVYMVLWSKHKGPTAEELLTLIYGVLTKEKGSNPKPQIKANKARKQPTKKTRKNRDSTEGRKKVYYEIEEEPRDDKTLVKDALGLSGRVQNEALTSYPEVKKKVPPPILRVIDNARSPEEAEPQEDVKTTPPPLPTASLNDGSENKEQKKEA